MTDIYNNDLNIANYIDMHPINQNPNAAVESIFNIDKINAAKQWIIDSNLALMLPTSHLEQLENDWEKYNALSHENKKKADWKAIELFGVDNEQIYYYLKEQYSRADFQSDIEKYIKPSATENDPMIDDHGRAMYEGYISDYDLDQIADLYDSDSAVHYTSIDVDKARKWAEESNRIIITPTRTLKELEDLWDAFNAMIKKHRRESDWISEELFGVTNLKHYEFLKTSFLRDDFSNDDINKYAITESGNIHLVKTPKSMIENYLANESNKMNSSEFAQCLLRLKQNMAKGYNEEYLYKPIFDNSLARYNEDSIITSYDVDFGSMPLLTPNEMIDAGVSSESDPENLCYGVEPISNVIDEDLTVKEWFEMYKAEFDGFHTEMSTYSMKWRNKLLEYMNMNQTPAVKQAILELGWNPDVPFNPTTEKLAHDKISHIVAENNSRIPTKFYDLRGFNIPINMDMKLTESTIDLQPVYIIMSEGKTVFSGAIKKITDTIYSHVSIAFDGKLDKMYSFGIKGSEKKIAGGFIEEDIKINNPPDGRVDVYVFFAPSRIVNQIKVKIQEFKDNTAKTSYSYKNLFTFLFNVPYNNDWKMVCSQFVDRMLKSVGIDITNKDSSLVSPKDMDVASKNHKNIYHVYFGYAQSYDGDKTNRLIRSLINKAKPLKEENVFYRYNESHYISNIIYNADNPIVLRDMREFKSIVSDKVTSKILEDTLFDSLDLHPYAQFTEDDAIKWNDSITHGTVSGFSDFIDNFKILTNVV